MKKTIVIAILLTCFALGSFAAFDSKPACARSMLLVDANNKVCPVTGAAIGKKRFNTAYKGRRYWFSSYSAVLEFKKDPEKYLAAASETKAPARRRRAW